MKARNDVVTSSPLKWATGFVLLCLFPFLATAAPSVKIICDAYDDKVEVEETFHITIEAIDCAGSIDISQMPPGVKVVYHTTSQTSRTSMINGVTQQVNSTSLILTCKGQTVGKYKFGPITVGGKKSNIISYQVVAATPGKNRGKGTNAGSPNMPSSSGGPLFIGKGNEEMYLRAFVNKSTAYEQEAIEYTVKLYTTYGDIKFLGAAAAPKFDGFVVEESSDVSSSFSFEDINGQTFKTAVIAKYIIFPQKAGKLKVTGNTYTVSTDARQYYHDPYYQTITVKQPVQLNVTPNDISIDVKELPTPVPEGFIGGVGKFSLRSSISSTSLATNTAASYVIAIEGRGNIRYVKIPGLDKYFPNSFEIYSPEIDTEAKADGATVVGTSKSDFSFIPRESGNFEIPIITLWYFNPDKGEYEALHTSAYKLEVSLGETSDKSQQTLSFNSSLLPAGEGLQKLKTPYLNNFLYWLWYIVPVFIFVVSLVGYRKYLKDRDDMVLFRSRNANKMAMKRLAKAYQYLQSKNEDKFYEEMLSALWGYLADKLKIPTSELNRSNVSEEFGKHGVKVETFQPILNLIDECEYARYTPVSRDANMKQLYTDAVESLSQVESEYEEETRNSAKSSIEDDVADGDGYVNTSTIKSDSPTNDQTANEDNESDE